MGKLGVMIFIEMDESQYHEVIADLQILCERHDIIFAITEKKKPSFGI